MRTLSPSINSLINRKFGVDPVMIIGVKWTDDNEVYYSSHDVPGAVKAIVSIDNLDITQQISGSGASQSVTLTLSDVTGYLTSILSTVDIHKRPARVYLAFDGVPLDQSVILLDGEINSEMQWNDSDRTLRFTILSKLEGRLFGFAMEDGLFDRVDQENRTKPWPFRFGETCNAPAVKVANGLKGFLRLGQGVVDPTLDAQICQAQQIDCPFVEGPVDDSASNPSTVITDTTTSFYSQLEEDPFGFTTSSNFGVPFVDPAYSADSSISRRSSGQRTLIPDERCQRSKFTKLCQLLRDRANQLVYVAPELIVGGGDLFPQGVVTHIRVGGVVYEGVFSGETFTILGETRLDAPTNPDCSQVGTPGLGYTEVNEPQPSSLGECSTPTSRVTLQVIDGAGEAFRRLNEFESTGFKWLPGGTEVQLEETSTQVHVVSCIPGTVTQVMAYRTFGDTKVLTTVPTDFYSVVTTDYGDLEVVEVHLVRPLSDYLDQNWDDELYVSFDSDVGPNPVTVMQWIIENYTDFTVDATSFAAVLTRLANYPCNFYHAEKTNVLEVLNRIAYEARCTLTITDNVVKITYLSIEPDTVRTLTSADLVAGSFDFKHTRTEELTTSSRVSWKPWEAEILSTKVAERTFTVENNVEKYGYFGSTEFYSTITNEQQALKTATFWSIRDSNTWRVISFQTTIQNLDLEIFDCVTIDVPVFPTTKAVIRSVRYNPETSLIEIEAWTPILSGSTTPYFFAWPAGQPSAIPYPANNFDLPVPAISVTPPEGHPLYIPSPNAPAPATAGDRFPSDLDDVFPVTTCQDPTDSEVVDTIEPQFNRIEFLDLEAEAIAADKAATNGFNVDVEGPKKGTACGLPTYEGCVWTVTVQYGTATTVAGVIPGTCTIQPGPCGSYRGVRCGGPVFNICRRFGSKAMATAYSNAMKAQREAVYCNFIIGAQGPTAVGDPTGGGSECGPDGSGPAGDVELNQE